MNLFGWELGLWQFFGFLGNAIFGSRFFVQMIYSNRAGRVVVPMIFWYLSVFGSAILLVYFTHKKDFVGTLGSSLNMIPYFRNIYLHKRHEKESAEKALAELETGEDLETK